MDSSGLAMIFARRWRRRISWNWPVGVGLAVEVGYQRPPFANDTWTIRLRPIFDKRFGRYYLAVNPAFDWSLHGQNSGQGAGFAPSVKFSYAFNRYVSAGAEYYGNYGSVQDIAGFHHQQQQFFPDTRCEDCSRMESQSWGWDRSHDDYR